MDRLGIEPDPLAGCAAKLLCGPAARRRRFPAGCPLAFDVAFEPPQPPGARPHLLDGAFLQPTAGETGFREGAFGRAPFGFRAFEVRGSVLPLFAQRLQPPGFAAGEPVQVRRKRRPTPLQIDSFPAPFEELPGTVHEHRLASGRLRLAAIPIQPLDPLLLTSKIAPLVLELPQPRLGIAQLPCLPAPELGGHGEAAALPGCFEVVAARDLARDAPGDLGIGAGVARQQVLQMQGVAGDEPMLRERGRLGRPAVVRPVEGAAGAHGRERAFPGRKGGFDVDALSGKLVGMEGGAHGAEQARLAGRIGSDDHVDTVSETVDLEAGAGDAGQTADRETAQLHAGRRRWASSSSSARSAARSSRPATSVAAGGPSAAGSARNRGPRRLASASR